MQLRKYKTPIILILLVVVCFILQSTVFNYLMLANIKPNLLIILTSSIGFMRGKKDGMLVGILSGFLIDICYGNILGFYAIIFLFIGYINGFFRRLFFDEDIKLPLVLIGSSQFVYSSVICFVQFILRTRFNFGYYLGSIIIPELVYTLLVTLIFYQIIKKINHKLEATEKRSARKFV